MHTKSNPGPYDCYANAAPDEPMFVLLGRDPTAAMVVTFWRKMRTALGQDVQDPQLMNAREASITMAAYARAQGKDVDAAYKAFGDAILDAAESVRRERALLERTR